ncbi:MAG: sulfatase-like hydrolase/transferase, partial [Planctomycetota bacterium]
PLEEDQQHIRNLYDGGVAAFDYAVGKILDELEQLGIADDTLIVIYADHGENLYDNGNLLEHGERFGGGDFANRIPLIIADPTQDFARHRVDTLVSSLDIMPTILSLLNLPIPATVKGRDLLPLMQGGDVESRPLFAETGLWLGGAPESYAGSGLDYPSILSSLTVDPIDGTLVLNPRYERRVIKSKHRQVRTEKFKLIYIPVPEVEHVEFHLYDVKADPENQNDLYGLKEHEATAEALKKELFEWMLEESGTGLDERLHLVRQYNFFE